MGQAGESVMSLARLGLKIPAIIDDAHRITRKLSDMAKADAPKPPHWHTPALLTGAAALVVIAIKMVLR